MFSPSTHKIEEFYSSLQTEFRIEDDIDINKYLVIELEHLPDGSI